MLIHESVKIGENTRIQPTVVMEEGCVIGANCFIGHYTVMRPNTIIGDNTVIGHLCVFEGDCSVGSDVLIGAQCHITKGAIIEDKVFLAPGFIGANDPDMLHLRRHLKPFTPQAFVIKKGARIGIGAKIFPGVIIGENSVVGMGAVVTKNVSQYTVVYGCPARIQGIVPAEEFV